MQSFTIETGAREAFLDITARVAECARAETVTSGICTVHAPHTTAGVTINENADPDVTRDILWALSSFVPEGSGYHHGEGKQSRPREGEPHGLLGDGAHRRGPFGIGHLAGDLPL